MREELREQVANERRRLKKVRESLSAAIVEGANGDENYVPFYIAIADYIEASMGRLRIQDIRLVEMLAEKVPSSVRDGQAALDGLHDVLSGNQQHLDRFLAARETLKAKGTTAVEEFEESSRAYTNYITSRMGHSGPSSDLTQKYLSQEDWDYMAHVSDEAMAKEQELFDRVFAAQPVQLQG